MQPSSRPSQKQNANCKLQIGNRNKRQREQSLSRSKFEETVYPMPILAAQRSRG